MEMKDDLLEWKEYVPRNLVRFPPSAFELARQAELASTLADIVRDYRAQLHARKRERDELL